MAKFKELEKLNKFLKKSISLVAAEYYYIKELLKELDIIENDDTLSAIKNMKKGFKIWKFIGKTEKKNDRSLSKLMKQLSKIEERLPADLKKQSNRLLKELEITKNNLERLASRHVGKIKEDLSNILTEEQLVFVYVGKKDMNSREIVGALQAFFETAKKDINELNLWVKSVEAVLEEMKEFENFLERNA